MSFKMRKKESSSSVNRPREFRYAIIPVSGTDEEEIKDELCKQINTKKKMLLQMPSDICKHDELEEFFTSEKVGTTDQDAQTEEEERVRVTYSYTQMDVTVEIGNNVEEGDTQTTSFGSDDKEDDKTKVELLKRKKEKGDETAEDLKRIKIELDSMSHQPGSPVKQEPVMPRDRTPVKMPLRKRWIGRRIKKEEPTMEEEEEREKVEGREEVEKREETGGGEVEAAVGNQDDSMECHEDTSISIPDPSINPEDNEAEKEEMEGREEVDEREEMEGGEVEAALGNQDDSMKYHEDTSIPIPDPSINPETNEAVSAVEKQKGDDVVEREETEGGEVEAAVGNQDDSMECHEDTSISMDDPSINPETNEAVPAVEKRKGDDVVGTSKLARTKPNNKCTKCCTRINMRDTDWREKMKMHVEGHSDLRPYECSFCQYSCLLKTTMEKHLKKCLSGTMVVNSLVEASVEMCEEKCFPLYYEKPSISDSSVIEDSVCVCCGEIVEASCLAYHIVKVHLKEKVWECDTCEEIFVLKANRNLRSLCEHYEKGKSKATKMNIEENPDYIIDAFFPV